MLASTVKRVPGKLVKEKKHARLLETIRPSSRGAAIAQLGRLRIAGFPARLLWLFVHLMLLVDFRNRVFVFFQWAWAYATAQRRARLIVAVPPGTRSGPGRTHDLVRAGARHAAPGGDP